MMKTQVIINYGRKVASEEVVYALYYMITHNVEKEYHARGFKTAVHVPTWMLDKVREIYGTKWTRKLAYVLHMRDKGEFDEPRLFRKFITINKPLKLLSVIFGPTIFQFIEMYMLEKRVGIVTPAHEVILHMHPYIEHLLHGAELNHRYQVAIAYLNKPLSEYTKFREIVYDAGERNIPVREVQSRTDILQATIPVRTKQA